MAFEERNFQLSFPNKALLGGCAILLLGLASLDAYVLATSSEPFTLATGTEIDPGVARAGMAIVGVTFAAFGSWVLLALAQATVGTRVLRLGSHYISTPSRSDGPLRVRIPYNEIRDLGVMDINGWLWFYIDAGPIRSVRLRLDCFEHHDVADVVIDQINRRREAAVNELFV